MSVARGTRSRAGFTLVELLVVIAIIGVLVALLLPAVQAAREAANRMSCSNNLKQIGIASHNYHDTYKTLPPGLVVDYNRNATWDIGGDPSAWNWSALLLPFMEQQAMADNLGVTSGWYADQAYNDASRRALMQTPIAGYRCPSDSSEVLNNQLQWSTSKGAHDLAKSNYVAMAHHVRDTDAGKFATGDVQSGTFVINQGKTFADILDGTSNTIGFGERCTKIGTQVYRAAVWAASSSTRHSSDHRYDCLASASMSPNTNWPENWRLNDSLASHHAGGVQVCLMDGSVRFLSETIDHDPLQDNIVDTVYERLAARDDGQPVGSF